MARSLLPRSMFMRGGSRGFSLVEALVATTLVAAALAALAQVYVVAAAAGRGSAAITMASVLALDKFEALRAFDAAAGGAAEYFDAGGRPLGAGARAPRGTTYVRQWSARPPPGLPGGAVVVQVWVTRPDGRFELARIVGLKAAP